MANTSGIMDVDDTNAPEVEAPPALFHDVFFTIVPTDLLVATALDVSSKVHNNHVRFGISQEIHCSCDLRALADGPI